MRDAPPALHALGRGLRKMLLGAARNHRSDCGDAELGGFFDGPLHPIELVDRHYERNGQRGVGIDFSNELEAHLALRLRRRGDRSDLGVEDAAAGDNVGLHAGLGAQYARKMFCLRSAQCRGVLGPLVGNPASSRHSPVSMHLSAIQSIAYTNTEGDA